MNEHILSLLSAAIPKEQRLPYILCLNDQDIVRKYEKQRERNARLVMKWANARRESGWTREEMISYMESLPYWDTDSFLEVQFHRASIEYEWRTNFGKYALDPDDLYQELQDLRATLKYYEACRDNLYHELAVYRARRDLPPDKIKTAKLCLQLSENWIKTFNQMWNLIIILEQVFEFGILDHESNESV